MPNGIRIARPRLVFKQLAALALTAAALLVGASAWADPPGRVGRIAESSGTLWIFDAEQGEWIAAERNRPLTTGDRLSAERDARAELQIGSATLRLDGGSELEVTELDDDHVRLHLHNGSLALRLRSNESAREFSVSTREGRFEPQRAGHYRIDQEDDGSFGGVIAGSMRFESSDSALDLNAGQRAEFWNQNGVTHYSWSTLPNDRFGEWVAQKDREDERDARRRPYVSPEMTGAEDLDRYGDWDDHPEYGTLWLPRRVEPGWAPYRYGHWAYVRPWGWTWVDAAPWGFAPFHYGRWVSWQGRWAWCPGQYVARPVYAPALVAWIGGPNLSVGINLGGPAVGWVPLSPREIYRPHYSVTNVYITNVNRPYRRWHPPIQPNRPTGPIMYSNQGVPGGVTVVSQNVLRERRPISNAVIAPIDSRTIARWQTQPVLPPQAVNRGNNDLRPQQIVPPAPPPAPAARVTAVPGGAVPVVPAAPGAARRTPWGQGQVMPGSPRSVAPAARSDDRGDDRGEQGRGRSRGDDRGEQGRGRAQVERPVVVAPAAPAAPARIAPPQRELQERRAPGQDNGRGEPRRVAPPQATRQVQAAPPAQQVEAPAQPVQAAPAPSAKPAPQRGRGQKDANERDDNDRQPPGQERRRNQRELQNQ